jgi:heme oxygenase
MTQTPPISRSDIMWYLNTGANNHMIGHKYLFEMTELGEIVLSKEASKVEVKEKRSVKFL